MPAPRRSRPAPRGFTLVELMIVLTVLGVVVISIMGVMYAALRTKLSTTNQIESTQAARTGLDMLCRDLRSAGYGTDGGYVSLPQPAIVYIDSMQVLLNSNQQPYPDTSAVHAWPLAYNPAGTPRPFPLVGTSYAPPKRYDTGAEMIRWTLDLNNDGIVNDADLDAADGLLARSTPNPKDFVLVRQMYGDSTGGVAGANGGLGERIALVNKPGNGVPPMFTVYFKGDPTPWDWSNGPVPANKVLDIERVTVQITSSAPVKDARGTFAQATMRSEVDIDRNKPALDAFYSIDGFIYDDLNHNRTRDPGELGVGGALLTLGGTMGTHTDTNGYYLFSVPKGTYKLKQVPPAGYGVFTSPDSVYVTVGPTTSVSFADTAKAGGFLHVTVFDDPNYNGVWDAGEAARPNLTISANPGGSTASTDSYGQGTLFVPVGSFTAAVTLPDSIGATTPNPVTGTMVNKGSANILFGAHAAPTGTIRGKVFRDANRNGVYDAGEPGIASVWVGCTKDAGTTLAGSAFSDANGDYAITVTANDPPHTTSYAVYIVPSSGFFPTSPSALSGIWVQGGVDVTNRNFGMAGFQLITLDAARVLSLGSADMVEKDWPGTTTGSRVKDRDLVMGSDASGTDQITVWFNKYSASPIFNASPDYVRGAAGGVLSLALDTLDTGINVLQRERYDLVTGTTWNSSNNNFFIWLTQNSSGNEGYLPTTFSRRHATKDKGDVASVLTADLAGSSTLADGVDILVGTKSPTAGQGTIELWKNNNNATTPDWQQVDVYPSDGAIPNNLLGEVTGMALADFDGDGLRDLVVTTRTIAGPYSGQLMFFKNNGKTKNPVFTCASVQTLTIDAPQAVAVLDMNGDGRNDVVVGTMCGPGSGHVDYWQNNSLGSFNFTQAAEVNAPGFVTSIQTADFGGNAGRDIAVGYGKGSYGGGVVIYYTDLGTLLPNAVDPTGGAVVNLVPAITAGDFNYGVYPVPPSPPFLTDLAAGVKTSASTGALVVIVR